jgi:homopolymeric O-antigen transport system ATP-binding protein
VVDIAITISGLGKRYTIGASEERYDTLRDRIAAAASRPFRRLAPGGFAASTTIWALRDVTHEIRRGEVVGVIGGNGAGKSTLLKILSRITTPTEGEVGIHGRVGSLLEVGTGFHPDLTGRENIFLNGAILGMRKAEIERKFDDIVRFAEIDEFIDTPVKHYSSGMYVRLGFAVAAQMEPEILIVDEVLAVGDVHFQRKCLGKLDDVARSGRTVLFVSHNMAAVQRLCTSAMLLQHGRLVRVGDVRSTVAAYLGGEARGGFAAVARTGDAQILSADLEDVTGDPLENPACSEPIVCRIRFALPQRSPGVRIGIGVLSSDGIPIFTTNTADAGSPCPSGPGDFEARVTIPPNTLLAGDFHLALCLWNPGTILDLQEPALSFSVDAGRSPLYVENATRKGYVHVDCAWSVTSAVETPAGALL